MEPNTFQPALDDRIHALEKAIEALVAERQALRARSADMKELEANRLEIGRRERQLVRAHIERHLAPSGTDDLLAA